MFRLANRVRTAVAQPLKQRLNAIAQYHQPAILPYSPEKGLAPFLSAQSLDFLYNMRQNQLVNNVNRLSEGTEYEAKSLLHVITESALDPTQTPLTNNASQAWNIDFFLQSLTDDVRPLRDDVRRHIAEQFGSFERFQETFTQCALALFGNGWTWLVMNDSGQLSVMNTFNAGSPFTAIPSMKNAGPKSASYASIHRSVGRRPFARLTPILGLSMWQESFLPDYGLDRETYVNRFWEVVNWSVVNERLMNTRSGSQSNF
ncbi:Manganese/iron superoxide dismutase [Kickxella alabastrina]|uniref:Manganese/iron superoxide dismutase n=1 Tax=Kickxella alabastrina TaxID=61397 RepID=UPI00221F6A7A|nr:Manganese/iron superoxide dismutase [Kickxella alabastrina]KAI7834844.1 Manganese/iron superoxide dismutase [Kickxella alabastrina]KAJ1947145.1 hypothetical protein GGF37_000666 [Kickxella alabastrina]